MKPSVFKSQLLKRGQLSRTNSVTPATAAAVKVWTEEIIIPIYLPAAPDKNPMFLEKRVYQGSSGRVYPLPFTDRIAEKPVDRKWQAVWLENEFLKVMVLPEIGGRIHRAIDKTNGCDFLYYQPVIKPALVGLAGPWASGGIEFNWPQHHRPATFLPVETHIERHADGSVTLWCSDHDPMARMKGMHGVCLSPGKALLEVKVRAYNRTPMVQTFLWWANVATRVHEGYQSFFPPDVFYVADHAKRAMSEYPFCADHYYGVNYGERGRTGIPPNEIPNQFVPPHCPAPPAKLNGNGNGLAQRADGLQYAPNDLSFYANIPVPTSYMCMGSQEDFFGGYDHHLQSGLVHVANHHISPGKKQWTWGNHEFGYAWDRNLTEPDAHGEYGPYVEIMAGVYTDNQPDFSFLHPGETKTWSQYWYPIRKIGAVQHANLKGAVRLELKSVGRDKKLHVGVAVTEVFENAAVEIFYRGQRLKQFTGRISPAEPRLENAAVSANAVETDFEVRVTASNGERLVAYQPQPRGQGEVPPPATEPPAPSEISSADELFITGLHLEQYRHATRCPTLYWREALRRDPLDARCNNAMGLWHLRRGEFDLAETFFRNAIKRLTRRNPNPYDGEPHYNLGLCLRHQLDADDTAATGGEKFAAAYAAFYKSTWSQAWAGAAYHALAEMDCRKRNWPMALDHLERALRFDTDNLRARNLKVIVLRELGRAEDAATLLNATRTLDPLDSWARYLAGEKKWGDLQTSLDLAHDFARAGLYSDALELLTAAANSAEQCEREILRLNGSGNPRLPDQSWGAFPLVTYTGAWLAERMGDTKLAHAGWQKAAGLPPDYCFPARLEEIGILRAALRANPQDARAPYYLGNLFYDRRRHAEAVQLWERSAKLAPAFSIVWRNLGIAYFNILGQPAKARAAYEKAFRVNPADARLLMERDQLWKRLGESPARRLKELEKFPALVGLRDDLNVELAALYNQTGHPAKALVLVSQRNFQPWEGGEGGPLGQWMRSHLALGCAALMQVGVHASACLGDTLKRELQLALKHFTAALTAPRNLGEAKHLLANQSDIHYWLGCALAALGEKEKAKQHWLAAANFKGDFQEMSVRAFSEMTYYSARSWEKLGQKARAKKMFRELLAYAQKLAKTEAKIDYFATSLPTMLLFDDDLQRRQENTAWFIEAQARFGLGQKTSARRRLTQVLQCDPNHALAADLLTEFGGAQRPC